MFGHVYRDLPLPKFKFADTIRISKYKSSTFTKGYEANFTDELFKVSMVIRGNPTVYELEDLEGEPIIGKFYEEELSGVDKKTMFTKLRKYLGEKK